MTDIFKTGFVESAVRLTELFGTNSDGLDITALVPAPSFLAP